MSRVLCVSFWGVHGLARLGVVRAAALYYLWAIKRAQARGGAATAPHGHGPPPVGKCTAPQVAALVVQFHLHGVLGLSTRSARFWAKSSSVPAPTGMHTTVFTPAIQIASLSALAPPPRIQNMHCPSAMLRTSL